MKMSFDIRGLGALSTRNGWRLDIDLSQFSIIVIRLAKSALLRLGAVGAGSAPPAEHAIEDRYVRQEFVAFLCGQRFELIEPPM